MPCLDYLAQVREAHGAFTALGVQVVAVATGDAEQARWLMAHGTPFPCLVDPTGAVYRALGLGRVGWRTFLRLDTYRHYWWAWRRGARQGAVTGDTRQLSGVAVLDAGGRPHWIHRSGTVGDYPPVAAVLEAARRARVA
jgi:hypothetical protein